MIQLNDLFWLVFSIFARLILFCIFRFFLVTRESRSPKRSEDPSLTASQDPEAGLLLLKYTNLFANHFE